MVMNIMNFLVEKYVEGKNSAKIAAFGFVNCSEDNPKPELNWKQQISLEDSYFQCGSNLRLTFVFVLA